MRHFNAHLHLFQDDAYNPRRYLRWLWQRRGSLKGLEGREPTWTKKAVLLRRLAWGSACTWILMVMMLGSLLAGLLLAVAFYMWAPLSLLSAWLCLKPYEVINRARVKWVIDRHIRRLKSVEIIGITGSFGKTSTKLVLEQLLTQSLITPKSYNTLFGIYKVVSLELSDYFRSFVCEMGAYKRGDIKEFCEIIHPRIGILTAINETHFERFKTIDNTIKAKFEILQNLAPRGVGVVNLDNAHIRDNIHLAQVPIIGCSVEGYGVDLDQSYSERCFKLVVVSEYHFSDKGTQFTLQIAGDAVVFDMPLVGKGHLQNVVMAIAAAIEVGEKLPEMIEKIAVMKQIPRRMHLSHKGKHRVLDNSFSSNPDSFRGSLEVLSHFDGKKVIVTPGMVELGEKSVQLHQQLGTKMGQVCDEVILVGENGKTAALKAGLLLAGYQGVLHEVSAQKEVDTLLNTQQDSALTILLENVSELPSHYL